jgi:LmbE family N-acetylglucosaminyl deacetylase
MAELQLRNLARVVAHQRHRLTARAFSAAELRQDAMVFAPHPDDETLGCGGTILRKRDSGATVRVVFMTDGAASHPGLIPADELARLRRGEAMAATASLGVPSQDVTWLGLPDAGLAQHHAQAVAQVAALLALHHPPQIFLPFPKQEHPDHMATHAIVMQALAESGQSSWLCQYPIWFLKRWPFVKEQAPEPTSPPAHDFNPLGEFNLRVDLGALAERKRAAIAEHKTQMVRRDGDPAWHTLGDVSGGDFLESFFDAEIFCCVRAP